MLPPPINAKVYAWTSHKIILQVTEDSVLGKSPPIYHYAGSESGSSSGYESSSQEPTRAAAGAD